MKRLLIVLVLALSPVSASAGDVCDDLWFSRNQVFDAYGYCFGSALGKAVFGNSGCSTRSPSLSASDQAYVAWIKTQEEEWNCRVDNHRTNLNVDLLFLRRTLRDPVVLSGYESACLGWRGDYVALRDGHSGSSPIIGEVRPGDDIYWEYTWIGAPDGWDFLVARQASDGRALAMGWSRAVIDPKLCSRLAG
ncbi:MAG TPA: DUF4453 domain-containing protein [Aliiroseovarius sp.]|nr:DUF4453 domain-containing protein [Aliiroseovarius sp.]